jgi:pseudouridylate synthase
MACPGPTTTDGGRGRGVIRAEGAVPATIAVIDGRLRIGLSDEERRELAQTQGRDEAVAGRPRLRHLRGPHGGTTVAATMIGAHLAGISVFATGGIGGVHKGAETSFDISADLDELAARRSSWCRPAPRRSSTSKRRWKCWKRAACRWWVRHDVMPAFWSRASPYPAPLRLDTAEAIARFHKTRAAMGIAGGMLVANPVPEEDEIAADEMAASSPRRRKRRSQGVTGKAVTPFLLSRIVELTAGRSLATNIALVKNNARLAARIARAL